MLLSWLVKEEDATLHARGHPFLLALAGTPYWKLVVKQFDDLLVKVCALPQVSRFLRVPARKALWRVLRSACSAPMQRDREPPGPAMCCAHHTAQALLLCAMCMMAACRS